MRRGTELKPDIHDLVQFCNKVREVPPALPGVKAVADKLRTTPIKVIKLAEDARKRGIEVIRDTDCELTGRQSEILMSIKILNEQNGYPPSVEQIAEYMGVTHAMVKHQLLDLRWKKWVTWHYKQPRTLRVLKDDY